MAPCYHYIDSQGSVVGHKRRCYLHDASLILRGRVNTVATTHARSR